MLFVFWSSAQVKETNFLPAKEQLKTAIAQGRTEGDIQSAKSLANIEKVSLEFDFAFGSNQARIILLEVLEFGEFVRYGSKAGLIATGRHPKLECLVGPLGVVTISVFIEAFLAMGQIQPRRGLVEHFGLQAAMEALFFALGLGVVNPAMDQLNAQAQKPNTELRVGTGALRTAPGRAVIA